MASLPPIWPPRNSMSTLKPDQFSCHVTHLSKKHLVFLCQLNKTPNLLAGHQCLTLLSLSPACPPVSSPTFPAGPVPSTCPVHSQFQASALAVHTACGAASPSSTQPKLHSLTKQPPRPSTATAQVLLHWTHITLCMWSFYSTCFIGW